MKHTKTAALTLVLIFVGIAISIYLTAHHFDLIYGLRDTKSFCSMSTKVDCDAVNASSYSEVLGVPVAMFSFFVFVAQFLFLLGYQAFGVEESRRIVRYLFYLSLSYVGISAVMAAISTFKLKTFCILCASLWIIGVLVALLAARLIGESKFSHLGDDLRALFRSSEQQGARGILFILLAIPVGSFLGTGMWRQNIGGEIEKVIQASLADWSSAKKFDFFVSGGPSIGRPDAPVEIVEFSDYLCPHCKRAAPSIHAFASAHRDDVRVVYQMLPLDSSCNKQMKSQLHEHACLFAKAALCANKQGKFTEANDWLFERQEQLSPASVEILVSDIHLDKALFDNCLGGTEISNELVSHIDRANGAGVQGTPAVFVNGRLLPGGYIIPILEAAYKSASSK